MAHPLAPRGKDVQQRVEKIVFEKFYGGPLSGSTERLAAALIAEFNITALASGSGDHAGLRRLADEAADFGVPAQVDPAVLNALLAENAALRGRLERAYIYAEENGLLHHRTTEAERKLAEAEGLLRECLPWVRKITDLYGRVSAYLRKEAERG